MLLRIKTSEVSLNNRMGIIERRINKIEYHIEQLQYNANGQIELNLKNLQDTEDSFRLFNIYLIGIQGEKKRDRGKEIIKENFFNF